MKNGIKDPTCEYQNCDTSQILVFGVFIKMKITLYNGVIN